jgi:hypothetical protein
MLAFSWTLLIPVYIAAFVMLLGGVLAFLSRFRRGRYLRPLIMLISKVPLFRKGLAKASTKALERENPELASAIRKLDRLGATRDPRRAQAALSTLTASERRAYMAAAEQEGQLPEATNRQMRRRLDKARKDAQRGR